MATAMSTGDGHLQMAMGIVANVCDDSGCSPAGCVTRRRTSVPHPRAITVIP
jgi:hypothetical protein